MASPAPPPAPTAEFDALSVSVSGTAAAAAAAAASPRSVQFDAAKNALSVTIAASGAAGSAPLTRGLLHNLTVETKNRFTLFPVEHPNIHDFYKQAQSVLWTVEEVPLDVDIVQWKERLSENDRYFISRVLAFFAGSDGIVNENLAVRFYKDLPKAEFRQFYATQMYHEAVHNEMYSVLIDALISGAEEKAMLLDAVNQVDSIKRKADWTLRWIQDESAPFDQRLIAFAIVEGVFFSGSFCSIFWLRQRGLMPGLCLSNELISRDEAMHTLFAVQVHVHELDREFRSSQEVVHAMVREAVDLEVEFITEAIPCDLIGLKADDMAKYIRFVADRLLVQLDYDKIYEVGNPFDFMERTAYEGKSNFFEKRNSNYAKPTASASAAIAIDTENVDF